MAKGTTVVSAPPLRLADALRRLETALAFVQGRAALSYLTVLSTFALLVAILWLPFGPRNGMPYETAFPYWSETSSWSEGFFYRADDLRPYTSVFYHLAYLIGEASGHAGSFVPYQLVYAGLWWGRGVLVFLILAAFFGRTSVIAYIGGILSIVHAADHALNWVGQLNQFGMMFWLLLSIWLLVSSLLSQSPIRSILWIAGAALAARATLWSYESSLFIMLLVPGLLLLVWPSFRTRGRLALVGIYCVVPLYYAILNLQRYLAGESSTYQASVVRDDLSTGQLLSDLAFNVRTSVSFWQWADQLPPVNERTADILGLAACVVVIVGGLITCWPRPSDAWQGRSTLLAVAITGGAVLVASFPAYLVLTSSRLVWRTQFLSGIGFAVLLAALLALAARVFPDRRARLAAAFLGAGAVSFFGAAASYRSADFHYAIWLRHKNAVGEVLEEAPRVKPDTVIAYVGVPANVDPFGDTMWFDMALRLAYPQVPVAGVYYRSGGKPAPGQALTLRRGYWELTGKGFPPLVHHVPLDRTLFIQYSTEQARTLEQVPPFLASAASSARYVPRSVIDGRVPDERAIRRYGPLDPPQESNGS